MIHSWSRSGVRPILALLCCIASASAASAPAPEPLGPAGPGSWKCDDGKLAIAYVFAPPAHPVPGAKLAAVFGFHGNNGDAAQEVASTVASLETMKIRDQYLIIGLKSMGTGWAVEDDPAVTAFIRHALARWPIDPRRVYGIGYSGGSFFLNRFVPGHSDLFAAVITWVGGGGAAPTGAPGDCAGRYWVNGGKDNVVSAASCRPQALAAKAQGTPVVYREPRDLGHQFAVEPLQADAIEWLDHQRNVNVAPVGTAADLLAMLAGDKGAKALEKPATWTQLLAIGGRPILSAVASALASESSAARLNAATLCGKTVVDAACIAALAGLLDDKDQKVRAAAIEALGTQASWQQPGAASPLRRLAMARERKLPERGAALTALARGAALDLTGAYLATESAWTLVDLLADDAVSLRQAAFTALAAADTGGFGYDAKATAEQRKACAQRWSDWCVKTYGERPKDAEEK